MSNPYLNMDSKCFWKSGVASENPFDINQIYKKKWDIDTSWKIATSGSCFAQHISRWLVKKGFNVIDNEPAPGGLPDMQHSQYGYSMYSARFGNIYTTKQLLQLAQEVYGLRAPENYIWERDGRFFDGMRPAIEPKGLRTREEVIQHRYFHLAKVKKMFQEMDLFIFTLGLTEAWECSLDKTVYPVAPGVIAGTFDNSKYKFVNFGFNEVYEDFSNFQKLIHKMSGKHVNYLLTVSPVPLTATASNQHVLAATSYSKSVLRAVAGQLASEQSRVDYFPSYEIITNQSARGVFFEQNMRSVRSQGVETVMKIFFEAHTSHKPVKTIDENNSKIEKGLDRDYDVQCEEAILDTFGEN
jgi:hypothetical protein